MCMFRGWFQWSKRWLYLRDVLPKSSILLCVFFCGQNDSMQRIFIYKCFLFTVGNVCCIKQFTAWSRNIVNVLLWQRDWNRSAKWLSQQSKGFYAVSFDALVKWWGSVTMLVEDMSRNKCFFQVEILCFMFYIHLWPIYWLSLIHILHL
jgi:hypothetical protein